LKLTRWNSFRLNQGAVLLSVRLQEQRLVAVVVLGPADFKVAEVQLELPAAEVYRQLAAEVQRKHMLQIPKVRPSLAFRD
jgi:hypothetical protein